MSTYERLNDTTEKERNILRGHFLERIDELEFALRNATKLTKVQDLKSLVQCNKRWLAWIGPPPTETRH